ncbi:sensor domain-containing diguanylate cyclase [Evansella clarkii]|uniref:sensor domain-containing diguanylate cyclase n=1 Tax=Evansella clarkii TaxID=79879 RepID=UPI001472B52F|nr:sensor domain-containing diguanylate cyclase [Evansella clarkii]
MLKKLFEDNRDEFINFINYMSDAIFVMEVENEGTAFRYLAVNKAAENQAGFTGNVIGLLIEDVMPETPARELNEQYEKVAKSGEEAVFEHGGENGMIGESAFTPIYDDEGRIRQILSVTRDITKRKRAEEKLQESEQKYQSLFEYNSSAVFLLDMDGRLQSINKAAESLIGYEPQDLLQQSFVPFVHTEELEKVLAKFFQARNGEALEYETTLIHQNKHEIDCSIINLPVKVNGEVVGIYGIVKDVTEEKRMIRAIRDSEERFSRLINHSPDAILIHSEGFIDYANEAAIKLLDAPGLSSLMGKSVYDFHPIRMRKEVKGHILDLEENEKKQNLFEEKILTFDGKEVDVEVSRIAIEDRGKQAIHSSIRDISGRKRMERALRDSEERYRLIADNATDLIELTDIHGTFLYISPSHKRVLGYEIEALKEYSAIGECIHPQWKEEFQENFQEICHSGGYKSMEVKVKHADGSWLWLHVDLISINNTDGEAEKVLLVGEEITEKKQYQLKIHQMAFFDQLTGLPNRSLFKEKLEHAMKEADDKNNQFAVLYLDCDNFKPINDELGHDAGDLYLQSLAKLLKDSIGEEDTAARIGGDEFNILLKGITSQAEIEGKIERILDLIREPWQHGGTSWQVTSSIGVAVYPHDGRTVQELIKNADKALYMAKEEGKNNYSFYTSACQSRL